MSYIQQSLAPGEQIVATFKLHWSMWLRLWGVVVLGIIAVIALLVAALNVAAIVAAVVAILVVLYEWLCLATIEQGLTNRRVVRKTGILSRQTTELRLASIETVDLRQSMWGRLLGFGDVELTGRGETTMMLGRIAHPLEVKRDIETAYSAHVETPRVDVKV